MRRRIAGSAPVPVTPLVPPIAADVDEDPVVVSIGPLTSHDFLRSRPDRRLTNNNAFPRCKEKGVLVAVARNSIADDETGIINRLRNGENL